MNIAEFLLARIAVDEAAARDATPGPWEAMTEETPDGENIYYTVEHGRVQILDMTDSSMQGRRDSEHIARHDPERVLAECAAKRAIIDQWEDPSGPGVWEGYDAGYVLATDRAVRALASVYKDHPDYQPEWCRPQQHE